jgi:hypothetical protein
MCYKRPQLGPVRLMNTPFLPWFASVLLLAGNHSLVAATHYVDLNSANPVAPYTSWATAATNIQDAVDAAVSGELVLVTNGIYATGGHKWVDSGTNRVTLTNSITLQSVNGPAVTWIVGARINGTGPILANAVRCVGIGGSAVLSGFTLTNGSGGWGNYPAGGGVAAIRTVTAASLVTNCIITDCVATNSTGGGASRVNLANCVLIRNSASSGGGASACSLINCLVVSNTATTGGGVYGNSTSGYSTINGCTIVGNTGGGVANGGSGTMRNCIVYYNTGGNYTGIPMNNCCTTPILPGDLTSLTNEPVFVDLAAGNFRLHTNSPCINKGNNSFTTNTTDLDGYPRINGGIVDLGAYEYILTASGLPYHTWAQLYGLATDGSADYADPDGDGMNNWNEWRTGTNPTNAASVLQMHSPSSYAIGVKLTWPGANGINYLVQRSTNLSEPSTFVTIRTDLPGQAVTMTYVDITATNEVPYFYRVGVP